MDTTKITGLLAMIFASGFATSAHADYYYQDSRSSCPSCRSNDRCHHSGGYHHGEGQRYHRSDENGGYNRNDTNKTDQNRQSDPANRQQGSFHPTSKNYVASNAHDNSMQLTDAELAKQIHDKLDSGWLSKSYAGVTARVSNGNVVLQGQVGTSVDKSKLEEEIRNMKGVISLNSQVTVGEQNTMEKPAQDQMEQSGQHKMELPGSEFPQDKAATTADRQLNKKIRDNIGKNWLGKNYNEIALNTKNGIVTLQGAIKNPGDQQKLVNEIQQIEGVKSVKSELRVLNNS
ncbi:BON domain-containing protein [Estrella lausannensis]|uniref:Putative secreted protein n=1 Tax=Estrella lausannensis TaxID=483423 RepID=A0A0H5DRP9_9BACT|nr:BON domain-containing protein [Estrella lausannensis]CRX39277.1 Putative secreted protein [Estrella lausannensis]